MGDLAEAASAVRPRVCHRVVTRGAYLRLSDVGVGQADLFQRQPLVQRSEHHVDGNAGADEAAMPPMTSGSTVTNASAAVTTWARKCDSELVAGGWLGTGALASLALGLLGKGWDVAVELESAPAHLPRCAPPLLQARGALTCRE